MKFFFLFLICYSYCLSDTLIHLGNFGTFQNAVSVSCGREEFVFVSDLSSNLIYKFDFSGKLLSSFGGTGLGENELNQPYSIDATNGLDVIVADCRNNQLKRLDYNLRFIQLFSFNIYNLTAEPSSKIYNPVSVSVLSTGEIFFLFDAGLYRAAKLVNYSDIPVLFGSDFTMTERLQKPSKITKGLKLDILILDLASGDILNYNNSGIFLKRIKNRENIIPISFTTSESYIYTLYDGFILVYDMNENVFTAKFYFQAISELKDIAVFKNDIIILLSKNTLHKLKIIKE